MKKQFITNQKLIIFGLSFCLIFLSGEIFAQANFDLNSIQQNAKQGGNLLMMITKIGVTLVGLIGAGVSGFNVFAKGQNSWQYIGSFVVSLIILGVGMAMFGNVTF